jgi:hypothetical protein
MIGTMAIFAGGRVVLGTDPGYYVIDWLPGYNFIVGVVTVLATAVLIWRKSRHARPAAGAPFAAHGLVMLTLLTFYRDVVAPDSLVAMTVRIVVWLVILTLMIVAGRK